MIREHAKGTGAALGALLASSATLVCCVLPALLVSMGAGATVVGLVGAFPQLVWLSEHKALVFAGTGALLIVSGAVLWRARALPCPADPRQARACARLRRISYGVYGLAVLSTALGTAFALVLPWIQA